MKHKGAALVEFALVILFFFTITMAIIDFGYLFWVNLTMQHAVREGTRLAVVGRQLPNPDVPLELLNRCDSAKNKIQESSMGLYDKLSTTLSFSTVDDSGNYIAIPIGSCWAAGQIIMIRASCSAPTLTPFIQPFFTGGTYKFSVSTTMKNENFR